MGRQIAWVGFQVGAIVFTGCGFQLPLSASPGGWTSAPSDAVPDANTRVVAAPLDPEASRQPEGPDRKARRKERIESAPAAVTGIVFLGLGVGAEATTVLMFGNEVGVGSSSGEDALVGTAVGGALLLAIGLPLLLYGIQDAN